MRRTRMFHYVADGVDVVVYEHQIWWWQAGRWLRDGWSVSRSGIVGLFRPIARRAMQRPTLPPLK